MHDMTTLSFPLLSASAVALVVFSLLAAIDGVYLHLWRYRLHTRDGSWKEHLWHTARAVLFVPLVATLFVTVSGGTLLWAGVLIAAIDQLLEILDMAGEKASRADLGGLSSFEYVLHVVLTTARTAAITLTLAARPPSAWALSSPVIVGSMPGLWGSVVQHLMPGAVLIAGLHVWLAVKHRPSVRAQVA